MAPTGKFLPGIAAAAGLLLSACAGTADRAGDEVPGNPDAKAEVRGFDPNTTRGTVLFYSDRMEGTRITGEFRGLLPNRTYAIHIHEHGNCANADAPGGHFDPGGSRTHGWPGQSPGEHHAGDLPNLTTGDAGTASFSFTTKALGTDPSRFSVIGRSVVLHAEPDDYQTQPAGESGQRIACGVVQPAGGDEG